jgi:methylated-DNA-[protein]-cysteine S-methyltransferase
MNNTRYYTHSDSPFGELMLLSDGKALTGVYMPDQRHGPPAPAPEWRRDDSLPAFSAAKEQLASYFRGERTRFDLPLSATGTAFQQRVWTELSAIPFGETISYAELARRIGNAKAVRAVGLANGRNPLGIVVPCHRVIGANGSLTGYGGGLDRKRALLEFEARVLANGPGAF